MKPTHLALVTAVTLAWAISPSNAADTPLEKQILRLHPQADNNGDGVSSGAEKATVSKEILKRFPQADKDGDGELSVTEQQAAIRQADIPKGKVYVYKQVDGVNREMEIYFPKGHDASKQTVPGIILFHGGGWGAGSRVAFSDQCDYFASRGMVAATVTYRLRTKEDRAKLPVGQSTKRVCLPDVKSAIRWFKQHANELGVDPDRIVAGGGSAGGHLCLLGTTNPGLNDPSDPQGIDTSVAAYVLFNPALSKSDAKDPDVDFMQHLKSDFGPAIVFFGSEDKWLRNGWMPAAAKMKSLGVTSVEMQIAQGQTHAFFNKQPWKEVTLIAADEFLTKLGFLQGKPTLAMPDTGQRLIVKP
ncbi:Carboxylesterase NlhH [Stieleria bergensis]|uniref:Carboxylesterase NlhH n=1 Tax=Stieleria bergensis TaxID=2528025 RepID=A0A517SUF2_9BACT|nr:Carboxylesterase NlhH [Planctomycetes bacterium SV_7m_r]